MREFDQTWLKTSVASEMRRAALTGFFAGQGTPANVAYLDSCRGFHRPTGTVLAFTRDAGHHTSGWWKNPDYERCWHLSLSFRDPATLECAPRDKRLSAEWVRLFYGPNAAKLWCEPPYSPEGKRAEVWHYRLFCAPDWSPVVPRGEVYSRELTEAGWLSYSDVQARQREEAEARKERRSAR